MYAIVGYSARLRIWSITSLVPRPFPPPVFDRILYAKTEGEGLGEKKVLQEGPQGSSSGTGPRCLPSRLPDVTHVTLSPRPSPSVFAYSMRSKTGGGNGLGTRLEYH